MLSTYGNEGDDVIMTGEGDDRRVYGGLGNDIIETSFGEDYGYVIPVEMLKIDFFANHVKFAPR